jgi:hypothetical protein
MRQERRAWTVAERHWLHGIYGKTIPIDSYHRPERPPIAPQIGVFTADAERSIRESLNAHVNNSLRKARQA